MGPTQFVQEHEMTWTYRQKLALAQAVQRSGDNWSEVAAKMVAFEEQIHPRPKYTAEICQTQFDKLTSTDYNSNNLESVTCQEIAVGLIQRYRPLCLDFVEEQLRTGGEEWREKWQELVDLLEEGDISDEQVDELYNGFFSALGNDEISDTDELEEVDAEEMSKEEIYSKLFQDLNCRPKVYHTSTTRKSHDVDQPPTMVPVEDEELNQTQTMLDHVEFVEKFLPSQIAPNLSAMLNSAPIASPTDVPTTFNVIGIQFPSTPSKTLETKVEILDVADSDCKPLSPSISIPLPSHPRQLPSDQPPNFNLVEPIVTTVELKVESPPATSETRENILEPEPEPLPVLGEIDEMDFEQSQDIEVIIPDEERVKVEQNEDIPDIPQFVEETMEIEVEEVTMDCETKPEFQLELDRIKTEVPGNLDGFETPIRIDGGEKYEDLPTPDRQLLHNESIQRSIDEELFEEQLQNVGAEEEEGQPKNTQIPLDQGGTDVDKVDSAEEPRVHKLKDKKKRGSRLQTLFKEATSFFPTESFLSSPTTPSHVTPTRVTRARRQTDTPGSSSSGSTSKGKGEEDVIKIKIEPPEDYVETLRVYGIDVDLLKIRVADARAKSELKKQGGVKPKTFKNVSSSKKRILLELLQRVSLLKESSVIKRKAKDGSGNAEVSKFFIGNGDLSLSTLQLSVKEGRISNEPELLRSLSLMVFHAHILKKPGLLELIKKIWEIILPAIPIGQVLKRLDLPPVTPPRSRLSSTSSTTSSKTAVSSSGHSSSRAGLKRPGRTLAKEGPEAKRGLRSSSASGHQDKSLGSSTPRTTRPSPQSLSNLRSQQRKSQVFKN